MLVVGRESVTFWFRLPSSSSGPGAIHLLNGLYDAKLDGAPVLAVTGQTYHDLIGTHYQQEVDLLSLFKDVAVYNQQVLGAGHVRALVDAGCRAALSRRGVAHITIPVDIQDQPVGDDTKSAKQVEGHTSDAWRPPIVVPLAGDVQAAADVLNAGKKTVILAGQGALGAGDEIERLADLLAAPIVKPLLGKATVPDDSPFTTGGAGLLGTAPSEVAMEEADTLLMIGTSFPVSGVLSETRQVPRRADRPRSVAHRAAVSRRSRPVRRRQGDAAGADAAPPSPRGSGVS